jgi:hypothetical protein
MLFVPAGMVTSSVYVPGQTLMRSPEAEAFTADWIVGYPGSLQLVPGAA